MGVHDIPLAYIIQDWDHQPGNTYDSFEEEVIAKTPHCGTSYDEDRISTNIKVAINLKKEIKSIKKQLKEADSSPQEQAWRFKWLWIFLWWRRRFKHY
jgi:hypothetical protein